MAFRQFRFSSFNEEILALLSLFPFEAFQEEENELIGFIDEENCNVGFYNDLDLFCDGRGIDYKDQVIDDVNWNQQWESSFKPVVVDNFCAIKATFHNEIFDTRHTIWIDPRMAFGTGHHETTFMMIKAIKEIDLIDKLVFDHGCGTGILSILAEKCGASHIDALDIEEESFLNTKENAALNRCNHINAIWGDIRAINNKSYDCILANINRKVLLDTVADHYSLLKPGGLILISGILQDDIEKVNAKYIDQGFSMIKEMKEGNWMCITYSRPTN